MITRHLAYALLLLIMRFNVCNAQSQLTPAGYQPQTTSQGPGSITRNITQDRKGNIWVASWQGVFKYDGKAFTNITSKVSQARFFSVLEDSKGGLWFSSVGSGIYYYDGKLFRNFTTKDGLASNRVTTLYEDKAGKIWISTEAGASRYDGKSFKTFKMSDAPQPTEGDSVHVSAYKDGLPQQHWMHNDVNAIIQDKSGRFWFGTRGYARTFDGKTFTNITNDDGKPFTNVRSIIEDKKGNIWLGGNDGLWRYNGKTFTNFTRNFVGFIYEDKKGNIWISSKNGDDITMSKAVNGGKQAAWALLRYEGKSLSDKKAVATEITTKPMIFGIVEDNKGNIWFGALDGVYKYDGHIVAKFKR